MDRLALLSVLALALNTDGSTPLHARGAPARPKGVIGPEEHRALEMLDAAGSSGLPGSMLTNVSVDVLTALLGEGLAVVVLDASDAESAHLTITNPGRRALELRRALEMIGEAGPRGVPETVLAGWGVPTEMLAELIRAGLAVPAHQTVRAGDGKFELALVAITEAGRKVLAS